MDIRGRDKQTIKGEVAAASNMYDERAVIHVEVVTELREDNVRQCHHSVTCDHLPRTSARVDSVTSPVLPLASSRAYALPNACAEEIKEREDGYGKTKKAGSRL